MVCTKVGKSGKIQNCTVNVFDKTEYTMKRLVASNVSVFKPTGAKKFN